MERWQVTLGALAVGSVVAYFALGRRERNMRSLANKLGFQFIWDDLPATFQMDCYPMSEIKKAWNVIEGTRNGLQIVIFDSVIGSGNGRYCTPIACHTSENPFTLSFGSEEVVQSKGWTALYQLRFIQVPGTIAVPRLEDLVGMV
ncbi:MAG: hypothetical protein ABSB60_05165 [Terracidiphilus sp.]|jgi:hypothetical protein